MLSLHDADTVPSLCSMSAAKHSSVLRSKLTCVTIAWCSPQQSRCGSTNAVFVPGHQPSISIYPYQLTAKDHDTLCSSVAMHNLTRLQYIFTNCCDVFRCPSDEAVPPKQAPALFPISPFHKYSSAVHLSSGAVD